MPVIVFAQNLARTVVRRRRPTMTLTKGPMNGTILKTDRLELIGCTPELLRAEGEDRARFGELLEARVPES